MATTLGINTWKIQQNTAETTARPRMNIQAQMYVNCSTTKYIQKKTEKYESFQAS